MSNTWRSRNRIRNGRVGHDTNREEIGDELDLSVNARLNGNNRYHPDENDLKGYFRLCLDGCSRRSLTSKVGTGGSIPLSSLTAVFIHVPLN
jgi:hypothetical protein